MMTQAKPKSEIATDRTAIGDLVRTVTDSLLTATERGQAFGEIVARFQDMAYGMAFTLLGDASLAEDAAQEAFLAAWRQLDNLREPDAFPGWFQCIVRTQCNRLTRGKRLPASPLHLVGETSAGRIGDPVLHSEQNERQTTVHAALATLPDHERTATVLYYLGDEEQTRIAEFLGVPVTTVKKRVFSARKRLRERMTPYMEPEEIVQEAVDPTRPSRNTRFSRRILLWTAVEDGEGDSVSDLLTDDPTLTRTTDSEGNSPLHVAAYCGFVAVVDALLNAKADTNARNHRGQTPLHTLAEGAADIEIAGKLLANGAELGALDNSRESALAVAARLSVPAIEDTANHFGFAEYLLSRGATLDLSTAASLDRADEIPRLVERDPEGLRRPNSVGDMPLHIAARSGFRRVTAALLHAGADANGVNAAGQTSLHIAAQPGQKSSLPPYAPLITLLREKGACDDIFSTALLGDRERLQTFLAANREILNSRDSSGATPLMLASWLGYTEMVRDLLIQGADATLRDNTGRSAVSIRSSAVDINPEIIDLLLAAGAEIELQTALALNRVEWVESLLTAHPTLADSATVNWAIENQISPPLIERLVAFGAKLSPQDAAALGLTELLARMLTADPEMPRRRDSERRTPLHHAAYSGQSEAVRFLLERGATINAVAGNGATPLNLAVVRQHHSLVAQLLQAGADVNQADHRGETPIFAACVQGDVSLTTLLMEAGATANSMGSGKTTPLHLAVQSGSLTLVKYLLGHNAALEARNYYGATPLQIAVREGHNEIIRFLLTAGADKLARDQWHRTPLHTAAWFDRAESAEILLNAGTPVTELSYGFSTALHTAAERGSVGVAERLVAHGADVNARSDFGRTPLHDAVHGNQPAMVDFLLRQGADPTTPNNRQMTPLHWAAAAGKLEIARLLLSAGADPTIRSYKDETPAELAHRYNHSDVVALLKG
jgi:RNA polymerase sigma factor (sigma-70 family)